MRVPHMNAARGGFSDDEQAFHVLRHECAIRNLEDLPLPTAEDVDAIRIFAAAVDFLARELFVDLNVTPAAQADRFRDALEHRVLKARNVLEQELLKLI